MDPESGRVTRVCVSMDRDNAKLAAEGPALERLRGPKITIALPPAGGGFLPPRESALLAAQTKTAAGETPTAV